MAVKLGSKEAALTLDNLCKYVPAWIKSVLSYEIISYLKKMTTTGAFEPAVAILDIFPDIDINTPQTKAEVNRAYSNYLEREKQMALSLTMPEGFEKDLQQITKQSLTDIESNIARYRDKVNKTKAEYQEIDRNYASLRAEQVKLSAAIGRQKLELERLVSSKLELGANGLQDTQLVEDLRKALHGDNFRLADFYEESEGIRYFTFVTTSRIYLSGPELDLEEYQENFDEEFDYEEDNYDEDVGARTVDFGHAYLTFCRNDLGEWILDEVHFSKHFRHIATEHPHVSESTGICLGEASHIVHGASVPLYKKLAAVMSVLTTYSAENPYISLEYYMGRPAVSNLSPNFKYIPFTDLYNEEDKVRAEFRELILRYHELPVSGSKCAYETLARANSSTSSTTNLNKVTINCVELQFINLLARGPYTLWNAEESYEKALDKFIASNLGMNKELMADKVIADLCQWDTFNPENNEQKPEHYTAEIKQSWQNILDFFKSASPLYLRFIKNEANPKFMLTESKNYFGQVLEKVSKVVGLGEGKEVHNLWAAYELGEKKYLELRELYKVFLGLLADTPEIQELSKTVVVPASEVKFEDVISDTPELDRRFNALFDYVPPITTYNYHHQSSVAYDMAAAEARAAEARVAAAAIGERYTAPVEGTYAVEFNSNYSPDPVFTIGQVALATYNPSNLTPIIDGADSEIPF